MTSAEGRACRFVELVAQVQPHPGNSLDATIVEAARKITADIWRERDGTSRSGVPLTRSKK